MIKPDATLIDAYQRLVGALLEHTWIDTEGTEEAIGNFKESDDRAYPVLAAIIALQQAERYEREGF